MGMVYGYQNKWDHHNDYIWIIVGPMATVLIVRTKVFLKAAYIFLFEHFFLYLAIDTVFRPSGIIQNGMEISSKSHA